LGWCTSYDIFWLASLGLGDVVSISAKEFEDISVKLASSPHLLMMLRKKFEQMRNSRPLFHTEMFVKHFLRASAAAWELKAQFPASERQMHLFFPGLEEHLVNRSFPSFSPLLSSRSQSVQNERRDFPDMLHIGGLMRKDGWTIVDANNSSVVDIVAPMHDLGVIPDESISVVYSSHVLEHSSHNPGMEANVLNVLREWRRVLKNGGHIFVSVPDFAQLAKMYSNASNAQDRFDILR
jgi:hypothetical protein